jgi:NACalpha-BTF3-like transcription factor
MFSYKLSQASQDQEGVFLVEFGEEELVSPKGRIMDLQGIYRFVVREVAPLRDTALYRIVRDTFLERDQPPWYPENASILVMVPFMHEDSDIEDLWLGVGKPLDPPTSYTIEDVDDWIVQAVARETGGGGTLNKPKNEEGVTMNNANAVAEKEPNESSAAPKGESGVSPEDIDWVVRQTGCPRAHVVQALKAYNGDMVNAMIYLTESDQSAKA